MLAFAELLFCNELAISDDDRHDSSALLFATPKTLLMVESWLVPSAQLLDVDALWCDIRHQEIMTSVH